MRVSTLVVALGSLVLVGSCRSVAPTIDQCELTITLHSRAFDTGYEVRPTFGPEWLSEVTVFQPGPRIRRVDQPTTTDATELTSTSSLVPSPHKDTRGYGLNTGLWTSAWDQVVWRDADGVDHLPPGWYQIQVLYLPPGTSGKTACAATSPPFQVRRETLWLEDEAASGLPPPKAPSR